MPQTHRMPQSLRMRLRTPVRIKLRTRRQHPPRPSRRRTCNCTRNRTHTHTRSHNRIHTHSRNRIHSRGSPGRGLRHEHRAATWWSRRLPEQNLPSFASLFSFRVVLSPTQKQIDLSASNFSPKRRKSSRFRTRSARRRGFPQAMGRRCSVGKPGPTTKRGRASLTPVRERARMELEEKRTIANEVQVLWGKDCWESSTGKIEGGGRRRDLGLSPSAASCIGQSPGLKYTALEDDNGDRPS